MKSAIKMISILMLLFAFSLVWAAPVLACDMRLIPDRSTVTAGETVQFTLERYQTHRTCSVPLEDTVITVSGGELVDPGVWQPGTPDILVFTVRFDQPGAGSVTATRECDKTPGLSVSSYVDVSEKPIVAASSAASDVQQAAASVEPVSDDTQTRKKGATTQTTLLEPENASASDSNTAPVAAAPSPKAAPSPAASVPAYNLLAGISEYSADWLPSWLLIDSNWAWWTLFILFALGLFLLKKEGLRKPLLLASLVVLGFYLGACPCPMGSVFKLFLQSVSVILLLVLATSLVWGRFFCGWLCPMGALQAFFRAHGLKWRIPAQADRVLKYLKYLVLVGFIIATALTGVNAWIDFDPFKALFNFKWALPATIILVIVLAGNLIVERFFCRYLCPLGAVLAISNRIRSLFGSGTNISDCTGCQKCVKQGCPMGALTLTGEGKEARAVVDLAECIACRSCESSCSKQCIQVQ